MFYPGLVSISFREHSPENIAAAARKQGLKCVEWGSDVHAPYDDLHKLRKVAQLHTQYGISCCSYGTYFRLGHSPISQLPQYIAAAKALGTRILRLWAGRKKASDCSEAERDFLFCECRKAAAMAEEHDVILCLECHRRSYTETADGALELMRHVNSPHFRMYWQPNPDISRKDNLDYLSTLQEYITHIHVFHWIDDRRLPLREGFEIWKEYLSSLHGDHHLLLEFMPDDRIESLADESCALHSLIAVCCHKSGDSQSIPDCQVL